MFKKSKLENGITVVMERMRNVRSVCIGIWVKVGSRHERPEKNGISHFLEHMFFKGTKKRTAKDIAMEVDFLGGDFNAFTSKEATTFYVKTLDACISEGIEILTDVFLNSRFPEDEIEKEKGVIKEEIKMVKDTPDDYVHEVFNEGIWGKDGLGQTVLGRKETVYALKRDDLLAHIKKYYGTMDTVVACAGNFDEGVLLKTLNKGLGSLRRGSEPKIKLPQAFKAGTKILSKDILEAHICMGIEGIPQTSPDRYTMLISNAILGGSLSSRLFQEIREKRGLAYSVFSFVSSYIDTGLWAVYAGTGKSKVVEVMERVAGEMRKLPSTVTDVEVERAKNQLKGNLLLGLESTNRRMQNIASQEIYYGKYYSPREIIKAIDAVTLGKVRELTGRLIEGKSVALTVLGPVNSGPLKSSLPRL